MADDPQEKLQPLAQLKLLVPLGERGPVSCAFGLTKAKSALLMVDKLLSPKKVRDKLKKDGRDSLDPTTLRFGQITIDKATDPDTVRFAINKPEVGGTVATLVKLVKKTGYSAIVINADASLEKEPEDAGQPAATASAQSPAQAQQPASVPAAKPEMAASTAELTRLVQIIPKVSGGNKPLSDQFLTLAKSAQEMLKAGNPDGAAGAIQDLRRALAAAVEQAKLAQQAKSGAPDALASIDPEILAALVDKADKLADAPRPTAPPKQEATNRLLASATRKPAPADPLEAAAHVAGFLPGFLLAVEQERPTASQQLGLGEKIGGQEQMLGIADLFAAAQRGLVEWEGILNVAEREERLADEFEKLTEGRDERVYLATLSAYNAHRADGIAAEARALPLLAALQVKFNSLSDADRAVALKEAGND